MHIVINIIGSGLGNNGGTNITMCIAEACERLGHVAVVATNVNNWSWKRHRAMVVITNEIPDCDLVICVSAVCADRTAECSAPKKGYFVQAYELWNKPHNELVRGYHKMKCIAGCSYLQRILAANGITSPVARFGCSLSMFSNLNGQRESVIGGLAHIMATKHTDHVGRVAALAGFPYRLLGRDIKHPTLEQLNRWYNQLKVWLAPSELEGLHIPPMEAGSAGCALVCNDSPTTGMSDYAIHNETALVYPAGDLGQAAAWVRQLMADDRLRERLCKNLAVRLREIILPVDETVARMISYWTE